MVSKIETITIVTQNHNVMSDPDDELIKKLRELKMRKESLEERVAYLENKEDALKGCLLNSIVSSRKPSADSAIWRQGQKLSSPTGEHSKLKLQDSLIFVREWVKRTRKTYVDKPAYKKLKVTLNKCIMWASHASPEEEDRIMRAFMIEALKRSYEWVKDFQTKDSEYVIKYELKLLFKFAVEWTSKKNSDDDLVVQTLVSYIILASNWTNLLTGTDRSSNIKRDSVDEESSDDDETSEDREIQESIARSNLQRSLQDIYDWVKSIDVKAEERAMQHELLDLLMFTLQHAKHGSQDDSVMKDLLQETLLVSLSWVISVDEDDTGEIKQQLVDSLIFAIDWVSSDDTRGDDEVVTTLLRQSLKTAIEWKERIDTQEEDQVEE